MDFLLSESSGTTFLSSIFKTIAAFQKNVLEIVDKKKIIYLYIFVFKYAVTYWYKIQNIINLAQFF